MQLVPDDIYSLNDPKQTLNIELTQLKPVHAIAGIGNPDRFFQQLETIGFTVIPHPFPDHYTFVETDICFGDDRPIIMTEKDAIKCKSFAKSQHWCLPVTAHCDENFFVRLLEKLLSTTTIKNGPK